MRSSKQKPARWMWALGAGVLAASFLMGLPFAPAVLRERLSAGLMLGAAILVILFFRQERYRELPPEEQRELDAEAGDERMQMIRQRAAWRWGQAEDVLLITAAILYAAFQESMLAYNPFFWLLMIRGLATEALCWYFERKY